MSTAPSLESAGTCAAGSVWETQIVTSPSPVPVPMEEAKIVPELVTKEPPPPAPKPAAAPPPL